MNLKKLKIAFILDSFPALSETFILNQITGLVDLGHKVDIYSYNKPRITKMHSEIFIYDLLKNTFYPSTTATKYGQNISVFLCAILNFPKNPKAFLRSLKVYSHFSEAQRFKMLPLCLKYFNMNAYDIIHCHFGPNGNLGVLVKDIGKLKGKVVVTFHGYDIRLALKYGANIYAPLRDRGDCFFSVSQYNRKHLENFGFDPRKIVDQPAGINLDKFPFDPDKINLLQSMNDKIRILTVGRLKEEKGLEFGIKSIYELGKRMSSLDLQYTIVGDGILRDKLEALVTKLGLTNIVRFLGQQDHTEVSKQMRKSHIYLLPSVSEALPVVLMEAHAAGLPIIATDVGSTGDIVVDKKSGFLVPKENVSAIASKLEYLIRHPNTSKEMARCGRRLVVERHDIKKLNKRLVKIYDSLLETGNVVLN